MSNRFQNYRSKNLNNNNDNRETNNNNDNNYIDRTYKIFNNSSNKKYGSNKETSQEKILGNNYTNKNSININSSNKKYGSNKETSQEKISGNNYTNKNSININSPNKKYGSNRKTSQEKISTYNYSNKNSSNINSSNKNNDLNRKTSQENNSAYNYSNKNSSNINSSNKNNDLNKKTSQEKISTYNYSNKNSSNINYSKNENLKRNSQDKINSNNISRKDSRISTNYIEKKKLLLINFQNTKRMLSEQSYIEDKCNINRRNKNQIEFINMNYDEYQKDKEQEDFFKIYFIFIFVLENELYKNADKILEIEDDIENYNPFIQLSVITVNGKEKNTYIDFPQMPFSDYSEIIKKYEKFKERKKESKYKIITYFPDFYVYKEKENKIVVKIFYPYVFSEFSNTNYKDILSEELFEDNIYMKSNFFNYIVNIEGYKNNYLENVLSPNIISSLDFGYFKINFDLPLDTFKKVYDEFEKSIDFSEFHQTGMIKIIFEGK